MLSKIMEKSNQKKFAIMIAGLIIFAIALFAVAAWVYFAPQKAVLPRQNAQISQTENIQKSDVAAQPQAKAVDETADWQTYRNEECNFEFKYPIGWIIVGDDACDIHLSNKEFANSDSNKCQEGFIGMEIQIYPKKVNEKLQCGEERSSGKKENITIGQNQGYKIEHGGWDANCDGAGYCLAISNPTYVWVFTGSNVSQNQSAVFEKIISTFKFVEVKNDECAPFFDQPTGQNANEVDLPITCGLNIGKGFENWQFKIAAGRESNKQFEFETYDNNNKLVQKIPVGDIDYSPNITTVNYIFYDDINFANDINFDGYKDLRVLKFMAASNIIYDYWIFDLASKMYKKDAVLTDISNASFDSAKKTVAGYSASGPDPSNWEIIEYEFTDGVYRKIK